MSSYEFHTEPREYQRRALRGIIRDGGVHALLMEPGTGKTKVVIDYLGMVAQARGRCLAFVLAPLSAVDTWPDEIDKHLPPAIARHCVVLTGSGQDKIEALADLDVDRDGLTLVVTNLDVFSSSHAWKNTKTVTIRSKMADTVRAKGFDVGVVDESHRIKSQSSNVSRSLGALSSAFPRRIIMTGTVAPHSPLDLFGQWRFLDPEVFGTNWGEFRDRYAKTGGFRGKQVIGFRNLDELTAKRDSRSTVVRKADALDLPPVTVRHVPVTLSPRERSAYEEMASELVIDESVDGEPIIAASKLVQWMRLRQLTSGHLTQPEGVKHFGDSKVRVAVDLVSDLVAADEKVVVFAHFIDDVQRVTAALEKSRALKDTMIASIHGGTPNADRRTIRKTFLNHDGPMVVVAQMRTVSLAVNEFVAASHAVYVSMSERSDDYVQSKDRLDRSGQTRPVTLHHLVVKGSIDEAMLEGHATKQSLESIILRDADKIRRLATS